MFQKKKLSSTVKMGVLEESEAQTTRTVLQHASPPEHTHLSIPNGNRTHALLVSQMHAQGISLQPPKLTSSASCAALFAMVLTTGSGSHA